jgi:hypothetical protein
MRFANSLVNDREGKVALTPRQRGGSFNAESMSYGICRTISTVVATTPGAQPNPMIRVVLNARETLRFGFAQPHFAATDRQRS